MAEQDKPKKETPWEARVVMAEKARWDVWDQDTQDNIRATALATLKAQARLAGVADDLLDKEPTEFTQDGNRVLRLKGRVDRAKPPHAQR